MLTIAVGVAVALAMTALIINLDTDENFRSVKEHDKRQKRLRQILGGRK